LIGGAEVPNSDLIGPVVDILSLISIGVGLWVAVSFVPILSSMWPGRIESAPWPVRIGLTLSMFGLAYLVASPLMAVIAMAETLPQLAAALLQPASANALPTAWGLGSWVLEGAMNSGLLLGIFAVSLWIGARLRSQVSSGAFGASLTPMQYWFLVLAAATVVWRAAQTIMLRIVLIRVPALQATSADRGVPGFVAGFVAAIAAIAVIVLFINNKLAILEER